MKTTLALALIGAALISGPALAQNSAGQGQNTQSTAQQDAKAPPLYQIKAGEWRASKLDGLDVYNTNNEKIGDISEMIVDRSGKIQAVVIGIGGFLGIGEHLVAVPFEQVQWMDQPVERRTSSNDRGNAGNATGGTSTSGSGSSTASTSDNTTAARDRDAATAANAPPPGPAQVNAPVAGPAPTQTRVDQSTGTTVTTTDGDRTNASDRTANRDNNRNDTAQYRPDHAVVAMTKDQLKALPEVRYAR
jgi:sporulation protein YlmC with PRC-barrel domain